MPKKFSFLFFFFVFAANFSSAQHRLSFELRWNNRSIVPGDSVTKDKDSLKLSAFRFYVSSVELRKAGKIVLKENNIFHLIDFSEKSSCIIELKEDAKNFDQVRFTLGIDSATNVAGVKGGALDPIHGMYWTWQSGYINLKCEGHSNTCVTRSGDFSLHLGGYRSPHSTAQIITLNASDSDTTVISFDLKKWLGNIELKTKPNLMSPGAEAARLSKHAAEAFKSETP